MAWYSETSGPLPVRDLYDKNDTLWGYFLLHKGNYLHPVAQKPPNAWGLYDMLGNAEEYTLDLYDQDYYASGAAVNPRGPLSGSSRVVRGGSWTSLAEWATLSYRGSGTNNMQGVPEVGFRCVWQTADTHLTAHSPETLDQLKQKFTEAYTSALGRELAFRPEALNSPTKFSPATPTMA